MTEVALSDPVALVFEIAPNRYDLLEEDFHIQLLNLTKGTPAVDITNHVSITAVIDESIQDYPLATRVVGDYDANDTVFQFIETVENTIYPGHTIQFHFDEGDVIRQVVAVNRTASGDNYFRLEKPLGAQVSDGASIFRSQYLGKYLMTYLPLEEGQYLVMITIESSSIFSQDLTQFRVTPPETSSPTTPDLPVNTVLQKLSEIQSAVDCSRILNRR